MNVYLDDQRSLQVEHGEVRQSPLLPNTPVTGLARKLHRVGVQPLQTTKRHRRSKHPCFHPSLRSPFHFDLSIPVKPPGHHLLLGSPSQNHQHRHQHRHQTFNALPQGCTHLRHVRVCFPPPALGTQLGTSSWSATSSVSLPPYPNLPAAPYGFLFLHGARNTPPRSSIALLTSAEQPPKPVRSIDLSARPAT